MPTIDLSLVRTMNHSLIWKELRATSNLKVMSEGTRNILQPKYSSGLWRGCTCLHPNFIPRTTQMVNSIRQNDLLILQNILLIPLYIHFYVPSIMICLYIVFCDKQTDCKQTSQKPRWVKRGHLEQALKADPCSPRRHWKSLEVDCLRDKFFPNFLISIFLGMDFFWIF